MKLKFCLIFLALTAACARGPRPVYYWSSVEGRNCFWQCQQMMNGCNLNCHGGDFWLNLICMNGCRQQGDGCASSCPDVQRVMQ